MPQCKPMWWFRLATDVALANYLFVDLRFIRAAIALAAIQIPVFARRGGGWLCFPAQLRIVCTILLVLGLWQPFRFIDGMQLVGTAAMVLTGYCLFADCMSLQPINRSKSFSKRLIGRPFLTPPVPGSILPGRTAA